jgi:hypothetical protein
MVDPQYSLVAKIDKCFLPAPIRVAPCPPHDAGTTERISS